MPKALPPAVKKMLEDKAYGHVITFDESGKPQVTMVWVDVDGDEVLFNTAEGRLKPKNLQRDPRVIVSVQDRNDPQAYAVFHGKATVSEAGADAHRLDDELRLAGTTAVDRRLPDPGARRDALDAHAGVALLGERRERRGEDGLVA